MDPSTPKRVHADHVCKCGYVVRAYVTDMIWNICVCICVCFCLFVGVFFCWFCSAELIATTGLLHKSTMALDLTLAFPPLGLQPRTSCISPLYLVARITTSILPFFLKPLALFLVNDENLNLNMNANALYLPSEGKCTLESWTNDYILKDCTFLNSSHLI